MTLALAKAMHVYQSFKWGLNPTAQTGGASFAGLPPPKTYFGGGGFWTLEMGSMVITPARRKAYAALEGQLDGGSVPIIISKLNADTDQPWFSDAERILSRAGGGGYPYIDIKTTSAVVLRQTALNVNLNHCVAGGLVGGEHFTIVHTNWGPRMYRVITAAAPVASVQAITIRPAIREACVLHTVMDFDDPRCTMSLADGVDIAPEFDLSNNARPAMKFVEYGSKIT